MVPTEQEAVWVPEPIRMNGRKKNLLPLRIKEARSQHAKFVNIFQTTRNDLTHYSDFSLSWEQIYNQTSKYRYR